MDTPHADYVRDMHACFEVARKWGARLAVIHGSQFDNAFCELVPSFYYAVATLPCDVANSVRSQATIVEADKTRAFQASEALLRDPYAPKMSAYIGGGPWHVVEEDGRAVGYVRINADFDPARSSGMPLGFVTDVTIGTRNAALAVIRRAEDLASRAGVQTVYFLQSHKTMITQTILGLGGTYRLRSSCDLAGLDAEMVAILDLAGLTHDLEEEFQSRLERSAAQKGPAALSLEMDGQTVGFVVDGGRLKIVDEKQRTHRQLPRWLLTRLYMGYYSGEDVLAMGPISWDRSDGKTPDSLELDNRPVDLPEAEAALLEGLFPKLWPTSWPDPDVWPWVIGKDHPRYQHEEDKTADLKARIDALEFPWFGR